MEGLRAQAADLPTSPGVYLFKGRRGEVLYVGKAANLRARVRQYLGLTDERVMVPFLVAAAQSVDVVVTRTEKEALLLENTLIKQHRPRFNVKLRDDSNFLHLRLDLTEAWPRYRLVRRIVDDGALYFGPYHSASQARTLVTYLQRAWPLRTCSDATLASRRRPCLLHQMGRCSAPCVGLIAREAYLGVARSSTLLVGGRHQEALAELRERMLAHADALEFEAAARLRDMARSIESTSARQRVIDPSLADRDVIGLYRAGPEAVVVVLPVRAGAVGEPVAHAVPLAAGEDAELLSAVLNPLYASGASVPGEILVPVLPTHWEELQEVLSERRGRKVRLVAPARGPKTQLLDLARENAEVRFRALHDRQERDRLALVELARVLDLPEPPRRIECFDNSNLGGQHPVAAMAVFLDGQPARAEYRRYKVKTVVGADDYATMREILLRRLRRGQEEGNLPDLLVVDGGKGQVAVAAAVLADVGLSLPLIGLSKPRTEHARGERAATDKIVLPGAKDPLRLPAGHPALRVLQHLRDETHRAAVRYHRKVREGQTRISALASLPGLGQRRVAALLRALGSAEAVFSASEEELAQVPGFGPALAAKVRAALDGLEEDQVPT